MATIKVEEQSQKPLSIDDLFNQLDVDLRQENYSDWKKQLESYLISQLKNYDLVMGKIEKNLKRKFKAKTFLEQLQATTSLGKFNVYKVLTKKIQAGRDLKQEFGRLRHLRLSIKYESECCTGRDIDIYKIVEWVSIKPCLGDPHALKQLEEILEQSINNFRSRIKFDNLPTTDKERINKVFDEDDVKSLRYKYLVGKLNDYNEKFRSFSKSLEELNQTAGQLNKHSKDYPGRLAREVVKGEWRKNLQALLGNLKIKYGAVQSNYRFLSEMCRSSTYSCVGVSPPSLVDQIDKFMAIKKELEARDPKPEINIKKENSTYTILMESTKEYPIDGEDESRDKYKMDKPSLKLYGKYEIEPGVTEEVNIDLTEERKEAIFSNTVTCGKGQGLVEKLQVGLRINLPQNEGFKLNSLDIMGSYELPYLAETKTVEKSLTKDVVQLV